MIFECFQMRPGPVHLLLLLLVTRAWAGPPEPVEIFLVPPPARLIAVPSIERDWKALPLLCLLCGEDRAGGSCGCQRPLTASLAGELERQLENLMKKAFSDRLALRKSVMIKVVTAQQLKAMKGEPALGLYEDGVIYLSQDLTRREALGVLAHEYGHAWQYQNLSDIDSVETLLFEGFAEWLSYRVLAEAGDTEGTASVMRDTSIYGRGARWFLSLEKREGLDGVLNRARHNIRA